MPTVMLKTCACGWFGGLRESKKHEARCTQCRISNQSYEYTVPDTSVPVATSSFDDSFAATTVGSNQLREIAEVFSNAPVDIIQSMVHSTPVKATEIMYDAFINRHTSAPGPLRNFVRRNGKIYEVVAEFADGDCAKRVIEHRSTRQTWEYIVLKCLEWTSLIATYASLFPFLSEEAGYQLRSRWTEDPITGKDGDMADTAEYCIRNARVDAFLFPLVNKLKTTLPIVSDVYSPIRIEQGEKLTLSEKTNNSIILWTCTACGFKNTCKTSTRSHVRHCIQKNDSASLHAMRVTLDTPCFDVETERAFSETQYLETHFRVTESLKRAQYIVHKMSPIMCTYMLDTESRPESLLIKGFEQLFGKPAPRTLQSIFRFNQHTICMCVPMGVGTREKKLEVVTCSMSKYTVFTKVGRAILDILAIVKDMDAERADQIQNAIDRLHMSAYDDVSWYDLIMTEDVGIFRNPVPVLKMCLDDMFEHMPTLSDASRSTRRVV